jgi:hypothetical protein
VFLNKCRLLSLKGGRGVNEDCHPRTIEMQPVSTHFPTWLSGAFQAGTAQGLLVVYPNEGARSQALNMLSGQGLAVDTTHHLTLGRLVDLLHLDLKRPRKLEDGPALFAVIHEFTLQAAERGDLPLLFAPTNESRTWLPFNTERLLSLHQGLMDLDNPWRWDEDPGAREFHAILQHVGVSLDGTHPSLVLRNLTETLVTSPTPFTLNDVAGVLILDAAPDYTESEISFLRALAKHRPIHHLCNPGSFRLGHHGSYIDDVPYVVQETLPSWLPSHEVFVPNSDEEEKALESQEIRRILLHQRAHATDAALDLVRSYCASESGTVLIVDGNADANGNTWRSRLSEIGLHMARPPEPLDTVPGINHLLRLARLPIGNNAWSMPQLRSLTSHQSLPILNGGVQTEPHPSQEDWEPRPHSDVLEGMARSFHVRGGPGALGRWLRTMANAKPQLGRDSERARQALEETQWWLACVARVWAPFIEGEERQALSERVLGCISGVSLPMPPVVQSGTDWLNHVMSCIDWGALIVRMGAYDRTIGALQLLSHSYGGVNQLLEKAGVEPPKTGQGFIDHLDRIVSGIKLPSERASNVDVRVLSPEEAHGVSADLVLLVGLDVDSWSMKLPKVPWLDAPTKLKLGMLHTDLAVRKGRHHLRHLLKAGRFVIVFDSTLEEGGGPAAPLAEWLADAQRTGAYAGYQGRPSFLPETEIIGENPSRCWQYDPTSPNQRWLSPRPFTMESSNGTMSGYRSGHRHRDVRQRTGLALREGRTEPGRINTRHGMAMAHEAPVLNDRLQRQPSFKDLEKLAYMPWSARNQFASTDELLLAPTRAQSKVGSMSQPEWPHLGMKKNGNSRGISIDPRPLPPPSFDGTVLSETFGNRSIGVHRDVWSASRLQPWLSCPRQAWMSGHLGAENEEDELEDIDHRTRGQIIHDAEAALLAAHGIPTGGEVSASLGPLNAGSCPTPEQGWDAVLAYLEENVPWLSRNDAIATHRCRDLIGVTPHEWQAHVDGEQTINPGGRLSRLIEEDYLLEHAAPIACEWSLADSTQHSVEVDASNDDEVPAPFRIRGHIDRVDEVHLSAAQRADAVKAGVLAEANHKQPLDLRDPKKGLPARRWVIIRDLKTVNGPKKGEHGHRHLKAIFDEIQLAMYARAWEVAHPGDRVVGVGVMEVGESSTHYVELDPEILPYLEGLSLGERTDVTHNQFRFVDDESYTSNGFRAWIHQRLQTARRAVDTAASGLVHPVPSSGCSFCNVRSVCPSSIHGGDVR